MKPYDEEATRKRVEEAINTVSDVLDTVFFGNEDEQKFFNEAKIRLLEAKDWAFRGISEVMKADGKYRMSMMSRHIS